MSKPKITLTYFNMPGRAEITRLILAQAGRQFEDKRVDFETFGKMKPNLPYGQLPILEVEGHGTLCQSISIARAMAGQNKLVGDTPMEAAEADEAVDALSDIQGKCFGVFLAKDPAVKKEKQAEAMKVIEPMFENLEKRLCARGTKMMVANKVTWADLMLHVVMNLVSECGMQPAFASCDNLKKVNHHVACLPNIKKWYDDHKPANPKITLTYFDGVGRAEVTRLILAYAGREFEDKRISFDTFKEIKSTLPFGQLPILEVEGHGTLCQSMTIARAMAGRNNLRGSTPMHAAEADEAVDALTDIQGKLFGVFLAKEPEKTEKRNEALKAVTPIFAALEKRMCERGGQFLAGNQLTWADLMLHVVMDQINRCYMNSAIATCTKLKNLNERVSCLPNIKKWNEDHKK